MQETRRNILEILRQRQQATVDDIVADLKQRRDHITSVTVRHHLTRLQEEGLVSMPQMRRRTSPGRPQHLYTLTQQGTASFPNNYQGLASRLLEQIHLRLPAHTVNVILDGVAIDMAVEAQIPDGTLEERLDSVVSYMNAHGYDARHFPAENGYILQTNNCPYHEIEENRGALCQMDMRLIAGMLGVVPRLVSRISEGGDACRYFIPAIETE